MVFKSLTLFARSRKSIDQFWRKQKIFRMSAHFDGRRRNCYSNAIRGVHRALSNATIGRKLKKENMKEYSRSSLIRPLINRAFALSEADNSSESCASTKILEAACLEHKIPAYVFYVGLTRSDILINKKTLVDLSVFEPRTFKSLVNIAWARAKMDGINLISNLDLPAGVITEGLIKRPPRSVTRNPINPNASIITRHMIK